MTAGPSDHDRFSLAGRRALVTGGGRGIGRGIAIGLAQAGADVALVARTAAQLEQTAAEIRGLGRTVVARPGDLSDAEAIEPLIQDIWDELGGIDILVNNAGISPIFKRAERIDVAEWDAIFDTNLRAAFLVTVAVARRLIELERPASIVNITSIGATVGLRRGSAYAASKAGLDSLTRTLALEWADKRIRVNAVGPGVVDTDMTSGLKGNPRLLDALMAQTPLRRMATPGDIVGAVIYLASDAASFVTGQTIYVDGGWTAE